MTLPFSQVGGQRQVAADQAPFLRRPRCSSSWDLQGRRFHDTAPYAFLLFLGSLEGSYLDFQSGGQSRYQFG